MWIKHHNKIIISVAFDLFIFFSIKTSKCKPELWSRGWIWSSLLTFFVSKDRILSVGWVDGESELNWLCPTAHKSKLRRSLQNAKPYCEGKTLCYRGIKYISFLHVRYNFHKIIVFPSFFFAKKLTENCPGQFFSRLECSHDHACVSLALLNFDY